MKKTLGGDRLGSGKKMTVDLHGFERSSHDLGYIWRSTMSAGTLVPFMTEVGLPGDTFDIHLNCDIKTHPTIGPLFGSYKVQLDVFSIPMRLYQSGLHNNRLGIGRQMNVIKLPKIELQATHVDSSIAIDFDNTQINPSSLLSYLGIRGVGVLDQSVTLLSYARKFNAIPLLGYFEIYKQYYANKQEEIGVVITKAPTFAYNATVSVVNMGPDAVTQGPTAVQVAVTGPEGFSIAYVGATPDPDTIFFTFWGYPDPISATALSSTKLVQSGSAWIGTYNYAKYGGRILAFWDYISPTQQLNASPTLETFPLANIDDARDFILGTLYTNEVVINAIANPPYSWVSGNTVVDGVPYNFAMSNQECLAIKTYQSDLFNNWLSTEWLDAPGGINDITAIDTSTGEFKIESLILARKVYDMLNRIAVSGGSYDDWVEAVYDEEVFNRPEMPIYCGGLIKELTFQEVVSNSASVAPDGTQPLGTLAGKGVMGGKHKGGTVVVKVREPSYIMGIVSLTPRIDYSQGNKWDVNLDTYDDFHKPNLDQIGFQELITEQMAWWSTDLEGVGIPYDIVTRSAGKQPAWINYMTNVNQVRGNFAVDSNEMFMTLVRRYEPEALGGGKYGIKDLTTYIDPVKFNHIFADTAIDAQNFWTQISVDITARRKMSAKVMPNL